MVRGQYKDYVFTLCAKTVLEDSTLEAFCAHVVTWHAGDDRTRNIWFITNRVYKAPLISPSDENMTASKPKMPKFNGKHSTCTKLDHPNKYPECLKSYLHQKDLNRQIRAVHDLVRYTCTRCLSSFTRQYNLSEHLLKECVPKVGSVPITRIQPLSEVHPGIDDPYSCF